MNHAIYRQSSILLLFYHITPSPTPNPKLIFFISTIKPNGKVFLHRYNKTEKSDSKQTSDT